MGHHGGYRMADLATKPLGERPSNTLVRCHLVAAVTPVLLIVGGVALKLSSGRSGAFGLSEWFGVLGLVVVAMSVCSILKMVWFYRIWSWIPESHRTTKSWRGTMSPAFAACGHIIPYFSIYWAFAAAFATCDALEVLAAQYTPGQPSPRNVGMAMAICSLVFFPAAPFLMHVFMRDIGRMAALIDAERARTGGVAA